MGLFGKKTPEQIEAKRLKIEARDNAELEKLEAKTRQKRKLNIDGNNPDVDYHEMRLGISQLQHILEELRRTGRYTGTYGERPEDQRNPSRYPVYPVQKLFDYAKGCRYALDWAMKNAIDHGVAYYDNKGTFKFKEVETDNEG